MMEPKVKTKVSTSGGFYKYPRETRTILSKGLPKQQMSTIMTKDYKTSAQAIIERMKKLRDMATSQSSVFDIDIESQRTKLKPLRQELIEVPSLASIYAPIVMKTAEELNAQKEQRSRGREAQTEDLPIYKKEFPEYKDYSTWVSTNIDPFIKELKEALKKERPADIEQYVIAFSQARQLRKPRPIAIEYIEPPPPITPRNSVEPIIRVTADHKKKVQNSDEQVIDHILDVDELQEPEIE